MFKGVIFALSACFIWGLIFVVPQFMEDFSPIEVALGRYLFYGIISVIILLKSKIQNSCRYPLAIWRRSLWISLVASMGYYVFVVIALRYSTPAICALVLGICPITIAFYGNWKERECHFKNLLLPSILIAIGLVLINIPPLFSTQSQATYLLGLASSFAALISWTWYAVDNARFLKKNPQIHGSDWSTMMGVSALFWVGVFSFGLYFFASHEFTFLQFTGFEPPLLRFLAGSAILGGLCSWLGAYLWNKASVYLQISLAGQLMIFETIFGLLYVYLLEQRLPPIFEVIAIIFFLIAVTYGLRNAMRVQGEAQAAAIPANDPPKTPTE